MSWFFVIIAAAGIGYAFSRFLFKPTPKPQIVVEIEPKPEELFWLCFDAKE